MALIFSDLRSCAIWAGLHFGVWNLFWSVYGTIFFVQRNITASE